MLIGCFNKTGALKGSTAFSRQGVPDSFGGCDSSALVPCAEQNNRQQIDRLCGLIPIATEESAMSEISKPINSEQVFLCQVLKDSELAAISGGDMKTES